MTTMRRARPSLMYSATASSVRLFSVCGGVFSSTMRDSSWPILPCLPALPLCLLRPLCCARPSRSGGCPRWDLCLRPMLDRGRLRVRRGHPRRRVTAASGCAQVRGFNTAPWCFDALLRHAKPSSATTPPGLLARLPLTCLLLVSHSSLTWATDLLPGLLVFAIVRRLFFFTQLYKARAAVGMGS
jgi:hypothetical protein